MINNSDKELIKELQTGVTFSLKYLGYVPIYQSLKKLSDSAERENLTRHCMYLVSHQLGLTPRNPTSDARLLSKIGPVSVVNKEIELNVALYAFVLIDSDGLRILERHPIDVISFASPGKEECLRGMVCFVSNMNEEAGRRCMVFSEADKNVDFIMDTMSKIFRLKNEGPKKKTSFTEQATSFNTIHDYTNVCNLPPAHGLTKELWFHGEIDRQTAEALLINEGDFLVRMSKNSPKNIVLSGIANSMIKHFLLLDENDSKVRKQSQVFETVVELIDHHRTWNVPIISEGSELYLIRPIVRTSRTMSTTTPMTATTAEKKFNHYK